MMEGTNGNRRERRELSVNSPPASPPPPRAASEPYTPRSFLSRWRLALQSPSPADAAGGGGGEWEAGQGLRCLVRFPRYCGKNKNKNKKRKNKKIKEEVEEKEGAAAAADSGERAQQPRQPLDCVEGGRVDELQDSSGRKPEAISFSLGIGIGLVYLLVKSAAEFNKMIELRTQMEILLKDLKGEIQRKNATCSFSESDSNVALSASNCWGDESTSKPSFLQKDRVSYHFIGAIEPERQSKCLTLEGRNFIKMNQLEEELEVELDRLQINLEGEDLSKPPQQQMMELVGENDNPSESSSGCSGEEDNEPKQDTTGYFGVCPRELERRLHELLEARQQERIAELESTLECTERKLHEKEREICWWRDTASLVSKHKDETVFW